MKSINFNESAVLVRGEMAEIYRKEMGRFKPLKESETRELITLAQNGSERALNKVVNANLRIVWSIAKRYVGMGLDFEDVLQEGNIGLMVAVQTFDVSRGTKLSTWILERVREHINIALTEKSRTVRMHLGQVKAKNTYVGVSMDAPLASDEDGDKTLLDTFASGMRADNLTDIEDTKCKVKFLMSGLSEREKSIVCGLFGIGCNEVSEYTLSKKYNLTEERVRQIKWEALKKMQEMC